MKGAAALVAALAAAAVSGCGGSSETVTVTETRTTTATVTETAAAGLPEPVAATRRAILEAARAGDYEALRPLLDDEFSYTFGAPVEGGPIAYWRRLEDEGARPLATLVRVLELPSALVDGIYVWPWAYTVTEDRLSAHERELLGDLAAFAGEGGGYVGWRAGILPDGRWIFFVSGD